MPARGANAGATRFALPIAQPNAASGYAGCATLPGFLMPTATGLRASEPNVTEAASPQSLASPPPSAWDPAALSAATPLDGGVAAPIGVGASAQSAVDMLRTFITELAQVRGHCLWPRLRAKQHQFNLLVDHLLAGPALNWSVVVSPFADEKDALLPFGQRQRVRLMRGAAAQANGQRLTMGYVLGLRLWSRALLDAIDKRGGRQSGHATGLLKFTRQALENTLTTTLAGAPGAQRNALSKLHAETEAASQGTAAGARRTKSPRAGGQPA